MLPKQNLWHVFVGNLHFLPHNHLCCSQSSELSHSPVTLLLFLDSHPLSSTLPPHLSLLPALLHSSHLTSVCSQHTSEPLNSQSDTKACSLGHIMWLSLTLLLYCSGNVRFTVCLSVWSHQELLGLLCLVEVLTHSWLAKGLYTFTFRSGRVIILFHALWPLSWLLLLLKFLLKCLHRKYWQLQFTPIRTFCLTPISFQHCLCLCRILTHTHTQPQTLSGLHTHTVLSLLRLVTHTLVFWGYQSAECKLSPPKTVTCRQRCLAPCSNPLSSWHKNKSLFPW